MHACHTMTPRQDPDYAIEIAKVKLPLAGGLGIGLEELRRGRDGTRARKGWNEGVCLAMTDTILLLIPLSVPNPWHAKQGAAACLCLRWSRAGMRTKARRSWSATWSATSARQARVFCVHALPSVRLSPPLLYG